MRRSIPFFLSTAVRAAWATGTAGVLPLLLVLAVAGCSKSSEPDTTPPPTPAGLTATRGDGEVDLTWLAVSAGDLAGYYPYYREGATGTPVKGSLVTGTTTTITGLTNGIEYVFYVTAVDEAGNESDPSPEASTVPNSEVSLTASGWTAWEAGDYDTAQTQFLEALNFDASYADAYNGLGWTGLRRGELSQAAERFASAIANNLATQDARVGSLAAYRDLPGSLSQAAANGITALQNDPNYVFSHDLSIDADVVRLMLAQVYFRMGESLFDEAQSLMDIVVPGNGLDPADSGTWTVAGTTYATYASALLALIQSAFDSVGG